MIRESDYAYYNDIVVTVVDEGKRTPKNGISGSGSESASTEGFGFSTESSCDSSFKQSLRPWHDSCFSLGI